MTEDLSTRNAHMPLPERIALAERMRMRAMNAGDNAKAAAWAAEIDRLRALYEEEK